METKNIYTFILSHEKQWHFRGNCGLRGERGEREKSVISSS